MRETPPISMFSIASSSRTSGFATVVSNGYRFTTTRSIGTAPRSARSFSSPRSEEHTSELQSQSNLVCRLLLEKKKEEREGIDDTQRDSRASRTRVVV